MDNTTKQFSLEYWLREVQSTWKPELKYLPYKKFLLTPYWKAVRCLVVLQANGVCKRCKKNKAKEVHHLSYSIKGNEHQFLEMLEALCIQCHQRKHKIKDVKENSKPTKNKRNTKAPRIEPR